MYSLIMKICVPSYVGGDGLLMMMIIITKIFIINKGYIVSSYPMAHPPRINDDENSDMMWHAISNFSQVTCISFSRIYSLLTFEFSSIKTVKKNSSVSAGFGTISAIFNVNSPGYLPGGSFLL